MFHTKITAIPISNINTLSQSLHYIKKDTRTIFGFIDWNGDRVWIEFRSQLFSHTIFTEARTIVFHFSNFESRKSIKESSEEGADLIDCYSYSSTLLYVPYLFYVCYIYIRYTLHATRYTAKVSKLHHHVIIIDDIIHPIVLFGCSHLGTLQRKRSTSGTRTKRHSSLQSPLLSNNAINATQ